MSGPDRVVTRERVVAMPPEEVFELLADPRRHVELDGSGTLRGSVDGPERLFLGATFGMRMQRFVPYRVRNRVVEFEEGRRIAWAHAGRHRWRWEVEAGPEPGTSLVRESFDWSTSPFPWVLEVFGVPAQNAAAMERTLERLAQRAVSKGSGSAGPAGGASAGDDAEAPGGDS